jgi:pyruvate kinase
MKKTKIICTVGPASNNTETLESMIQAGMNIARLNFSHGTSAEHKVNFDLIKEISGKTGAHIGLLLDTKGPEIRTGKFNAEEIYLVEGQDFTLTSRDIVGDASIVSMSYKELSTCVKIGDRILIDDGLIELVVTAISGEDVQCIVVNSGIVKNNKGINLPGIKTNLPAISEKDYADILFGIENDIDYIAASFIRTAYNIDEIRRILKENNGSHIKIIAKIENMEGVDNIDEIIEAADAIMIARGDLGVEIPMEEVPLTQKKIIKKCNFAGKPVITATQMLDSMMRNPRPTRAEVADVANAIFDGTDAIMLSGETASGKYPVEAVQKMTAIALAAEDDMDYDGLLTDRSRIKDTSITDAIGYATCTSATGLRATAILTPTTSGHTPMVVSKFRPKAPIIATTTTERTARRLSIAWGVYPIVINQFGDANEQLAHTIAAAKAEGFIKDLDIVVITAGVPSGIEGNTNMLRVHVVGRKI